MRTKFLAVALLAASFDCRAQPAQSAGLSPADMKIAHAAVLKMNSPNWQTRSDAFDELRKATEDKILPANVQAAVIGLLMRSVHEKVHTPDRGDGESFGEGIGDVIEVVSTFGTREAALALLDRDVIQTGQMAVTGVAAAGPQIVAPVTQRFDAIKEPLTEGTDDDTPNYAIGLVQVMNRLATQPLNPEQRAAIEKRLLAASQSASKFVRYTSVEGLKALATPSAKARLETMAVADPYVSTPPAAFAAKYLVREAAQKALTELAKK